MHGVFGFIVVWLAIRYVWRQFDKIDVIEQAVLHPTPVPVAYLPRSLEDPDVRFLKDASVREPTPEARVAALVCENARMRQMLEQGVLDRVARERAAFAACFPTTFGGRAVPGIPEPPHHQQTGVPSKGMRGDALAWTVAFVAFAGVLVLAGLHG